jgi:hypothetical protein
MNDHPITPPPELVKQWKRTAPHQSNEHEHYHYITLCAAQWGADQELEACRMEVLAGEGVFHIEETSDRVCLADDLCAARRPKPPSLKKQALALLDPSNTYGSITQEEEYRISVTNAEIIRRALEDSNG